jgi:NAD-dependent deacetylase
MKEIIDTARPNNAHNGLARLEKLGILKTIITQNVDGLHQMAGNTDVIEFHGNFAWQRCMDCNRRLETGKIDTSRIPPRCECGGIYRPECVFFGEMIPPQHLYRSQKVSSECDIMLVIGTSALIQPAAFMPSIAKRTGAKIIEINTERTPLSREISDYILMGKAGEIMKRLIFEIDLLL